MLVVVTVNVTAASGLPPHGGPPPPPLTVVVALASIIGQGISGIGKSKLKSKSKSNWHDGWHELPVCVCVIVNATVALGSPPHVGLPPLPVFTCVATLPLMVAQGIFGGGMMRSKSRMRSVRQEPQLLCVTVVAVTSNTGLDPQA